MIKYAALCLAILLTPMILGYLGVLLTFEVIDYLKIWAEKRQNKGLQ